LTTSNNDFKAQIRLLFSIKFGKGTLVDARQTTSC